MDLLIIGGTKFLGRHFVDAAQARGDRITLFNRGQTNPDLYPNVEKLRGDRENDLSALEGRSFDAVVDTCGYVPRIVEASARALRENVGRYVFISSISVFADFTEPGLTEDSPLAEPSHPDSEDVATDYGALKAICEGRISDLFGDRALHVRPGLIVGPHDPTNRFTYWVTRVARGGAVLAPGPSERPVQVIDARDVAEWTLRAIEQELSGPYNVTGPEQPIAFGRFLDVCRAVAGSDAEFVWVDDAFLERLEVEEWTEMPLWAASTGDFARLMEVDVSRAIGAGLTFRPITETVRDTLEWAQALENPPGDAGLEAEKEADLLTRV